MTRRSISLFRRIERALETIDQGSTPLETIHETAEYLVDHFSSDLGITGGRIYEEENGHYELVSTFGSVAKAPIGFNVPRSYHPFEHVFEHGSLVMGRDDRRLDPQVEADLGTRTRFAAICVAAGSYVLSFDVLANGNRDEQLLSTLNIIRLTINQKVREEQILSLLEDARQIQNSILPRRLPSPGDFQLAARTEPAEIVGGDFYDVIKISEHLFYGVLADATGHGLPAALQVRDIYTGLRMGLARDFKVTRTLERLNRIINRSRMATRFVSLFIAEIDTTGNVFYCNAGHPPGLLVRASGKVEKLTTGGTLLGPFPDARYAIGLARLEPGDLLALYSDGITEAHKIGSDDEFGEDRLLQLVGKERAQPARKIVDRVFSAVEKYSESRSREDDQTVLVIKRRPATVKEQSP